ncbi:MAG: hypothetical protein AAB483_01795 [Patescibacteria group bacterium]
MDAQDNIYSFQLAQERRRAQLQGAEDQEQKRQEQADQKLFRSVLKISIILDAIDIVSLGTIGWFIGCIGDLYLYKKTGQSKAGRAQKKKIIIAIVGEKIPIVNILPLRTIMAIFSNPKIMAKIAQRLQTASKILNVAAKIPTPIAPELKAASKVVNLANRRTQMGARMLNTNVTNKAA